ncbi:MAG: trehalose utilization [Bryobacterales bacterium]|nr:trehalose utilization [Bryobacterales bacterium]
MRLVSIACLLAATLAAQPKRILYFTLSAGFKHDSIPVSVKALQEIAAQSGKLEVVQSEDVSMLSAAGLRNFDAVLFFTSGELPISDTQKQDLLDFVRGGKGFGGVHSATDTLYQWPEYGDLIGGYFNGHPWAQSVTLDVEDPDNPLVAHLKPSFKILDEIYQFRQFSRDRVRVLLTLDTHSVDMSAPGVNPGTQDFPLVWIRQYGAGRVFYNALGHFDSTWTDPGVRQMMLQGMLWLTGQIDADAAVRHAAMPSLEQVANSASFAPSMVISPGSLITIMGQNLTLGSTSAADPRNPAFKLAGATLKLNGNTVPLLYASPTQVNAYVPLDLAPDNDDQGVHFTAELSNGDANPNGDARVAAAASTPGIFAITRGALPGGVSWVTLWGTGMGAVEPWGDYQVTVAHPNVTIGGIACQVLYSGLAPGWPGLYLVNVEIPSTAALPARLEFRLADFSWSTLLTA